LSYRRADEATPTSGAASMTVCTNDLALCHLVEHRLPTMVPPDRCDAEFLVPQVVELEHDRVGLAAIRAGMLAQIGTLPPLTPPPSEFA
jgi:hypothetical protein